MREVLPQSIDGAGRTFQAKAKPFVKAWDSQVQMYRGLRDVQCGWIIKYVKENNRQESWKDGKDCSGGVATY